MTVARKHILRTIEALLTVTDAHRASLLVAPTLTVVVTRQRRHDARDRSHTYLLTIGRPNAVNRNRIKFYQRAGVKFPVRKVHLSYYTKRSR